MIRKSLIVGDFIPSTLHAENGIVCTLEREMVPSHNAQGGNYIMKKVILATALATSMGVHASEYTGEYLELICTIDGIAGQEVSVPTSNYEYKNVTESVGLTFEWEYEVTEKAYIRSIDSTTINDNGNGTYHG